MGWWDSLPPSLPTHSSNETCAKTSVNIAHRAILYILYKSTYSLWCAIGIDTKLSDHRFSNLLTVSVRPFRNIPIKVGIFSSAMLDDTHLSLVTQWKEQRIKSMPFGL